MLTPSLNFTVLKKIPVLYCFTSTPFMLTVAGYSLLHSISNWGWFVTGSGSLRNLTHGEVSIMLSHLHGMAASVSAAAAAGSATAVGALFLAVLQPEITAIDIKTIRRVLICTAGISV
jgi:hypothetical protein